MYYFLDIDGVLNHRSMWKKGFSIDPKAVENLALLLSKDADPKIVLSSTWRAGFDVSGNSVSTDILSEELKKYGLKIEDVTPNGKNKTRQDEIEYYIRRHGVGEYLVLDDDPSLFPEPESINLYVVDEEIGLTEKDVEKILKKSRYG